VTPNVASPGFTLGNVTGGSLADLLGLQDGDVLVSLNGQALSTLADVGTVATGLPNAARFELVIERNGLPVTLVYIVQ
jgi:type II secretory pathway component PulC